MREDAFGHPAWDIALIDPDGFSSARKRKRRGEKLFPHIGLGYLAASLEQNNDRVHILDAGVATFLEIQRFLSQPYQLVGITATSFTFHQAVAIAQAIKRRYPQGFVILGGPHVSIDPHGCLQDPAVDYAFQGEGEQTLVDFIEVLKRLAHPKPEVLAKIEGLVFRQDGQIQVNSRSQRIRDLDNLPYPAWHLFPMQAYRQHTILTSRGCPMDCAFCAIHAVWGREWIHRDPEQVVQEIEWLTQNWGNRLIHINDDNLTMNPAHVRKMCESIIRKRMRINWVAQGMRADAAQSDLLGLMRRAGCHRVSLGIESSNHAILAAVGKQESPEDMAKAIRLCRRAGIQVLGMFMIGNPGDTLESVRESIRFAKTHKIDLPAFYMALPYPRTRLWAYATQEGKLLNPDYLSFNHLSPEPVFETPDFSAVDRRQSYRLATRFCRRRLAWYHFSFWWPARVWKRNGYEIGKEAVLILKIMFFPILLFRWLSQGRT